MRTCKQTEPLLAMIKQAIILSIFLMVSFTDDAFAFGKPSTKILDEDITSVQKQIAEVKSEMKKYSGGMILGLLKMRVEIFKNTEAMLLQKRASIMRFISLNYTVDGKGIALVTPAQLQLLKADIEKKKNSIGKALKELSRYTGGLILVMKLSAVETERLTLATLDMRYLTAKHGIPIFGFDQLNGNENKREPTGKIVGDKEAFQ